MKWKDVLLAVFCLVTVWLVGVVVWGEVREWQHREEWHSPVLPELLDRAPTEEGLVVFVVDIEKSEPVVDQSGKILHYSTFNKRFFVLEEGTVLCSYVGTLVYDLDEITAGRYYIFKVENKRFGLDNLEESILAKLTACDNYYRYIMGWKVKS